MRLFLQYVFGDSPWQLAPINKLKEAIMRFLNTAWPLVILFGLGAVKAWFFVLAYAPADGADAGDYYDYAAYISGLDLPSRVANVSPVYPYLIYFSYYLLGNLHFLILLQLLLSSLLGVLVFIALRHYNSGFAFLAALLVLADAQIGILFNFASTEPIYIALLCLCYCLALYKYSTPRSFHWQDIILGLVLVLLRETRTVGSYLFIPFLILFFLSTFSWRRTLVVVASFALTFTIFGFSTQISKTSQVSSINDNMYFRPLFQYDLLNAEAGEASKLLSEYRAQCRQDFPDIRLLACIEALEGNVNNVYRLGRSAYLETILYDFPNIAIIYFSAFNDFLSFSGRQYYSTASQASPADVQCENIADRAERNIERRLEIEWQNIELSPAQIANYRQTVTEFVRVFCPPWGMNAVVREAVDDMAVAYNALNKPKPLLISGLLFVLVIFSPWARKFWYPVFLTGGIWFYHAAISAAVLNVQARYVAVTNPFKIIMLSIFLVVSFRFLLRLVDYWASKRRQGLEKDG